MSSTATKRAASYRPFRERRAFWIGGTLTALVGVALARIVAPEIEGSMASLVLSVGFVLVTIGLTILACATRRKRSEAFVAADEDLPESKRG